MHLNWNPLGFLSDLSVHKFETRFPPDVRQAFFCRSFGPPIPKMLTHAQSRTLCSCKIVIDPLGDRVIISSLASSTQVLFAVTIISWTQWHACRLTPRSVLCVSITRCRLRAMALTSRGTLKSLTSLSLSVMVLSLILPLCVSSRVAPVHLGGGITVCAILMTSYRLVPMSRTTNTRTSMVSSQGDCTCHRRYVRSDPR